MPLPGVIERLRTTAADLMTRLDATEWRDRRWSSSAVRALRADLGVLAFCAGSIERAVRMYAPEDAGPPWCALEPLAVALDDFARELARESGRALRVSFDAGDVSIDATLLAPAESILQWMVADVFDRTDAADVRVSVTVSNRFGALCWRVCDNGGNLVSDARLDHEDHVAFYPRLRHAMRMLARHFGSLTVEPRAHRGCRFEFTLPVTHDPEPLIVWGENGDTFAVRASQLCDVIPAGSDVLHRDAYGEYLDLDGGRVPLVRLDTLFGGAPAGGEMIAVVGTVEKRVAFFVPGTGERATGRPMPGGVPIWKGPAQRVVRVNDRRMPLLDAEDVLSAYLTITGSLSGESTVSGGVADDDEHVVRSQATASGSQEPGASTPRISPAGADASPARGDAPSPARVDVVVVEQSDAVREALRGVLESRGLRVAETGSVEEAVAMARERHPRVIVCEFRMPTMAARHLVEALREGGLGVPVVVTTSHDGPTADLLVEKLGASGYLRKPIRPPEVLERLGAYLRQDVTA